MQILSLCYMPDVKNCPANVTVCENWKYQSNEVVCVRVQVETLLQLAVLSQPTFELVLLVKYSKATGNSF